jgi:2'-5' RNA ligase
MCVSTSHAGRAATALSQSGGGGSCIGITIPVPQPLAGLLESWRASFGDPMASVVPPHITLITTTPASDWDATIDHARAVAREQRPFRVRLHSTGSFRPVSPVVFLRIVEGFDECVALHTKLQKGPLERDLEFPFHPHVTVAHDVSDAGMDSAAEELQSFDAVFDVRSMGLYEHVPSGLWLLKEELHFGEVADGSETAAG